MPLFNAVMSVEESEGVSRIEPVPSRAWGLKLLCATCNEETPNVIYVDESESYERDGGSHHFVSKCKGCKKDVTVDVMPVPANTGYYSAEEESAANVVACFEVRGGQPVFMEMNDQWAVVASSGARFEEVDLSEDWCDYDETGQTSVTISGVTVDFEKPRKK